MKNKIKMKTPETKFGKTIMRITYYGLVLLAGFFIGVKIATPLEHPEIDWEELDHKALYYKHCAMRSLDKGDHEQMQKYLDSSKFFRNMYDSLMLEKQKTFEKK